MSPPPWPGRVNRPGLPGCSLQPLTRVRWSESGWAAVRSGRAPLRRRGPRERGRGPRKVQLGQEGAESVPTEMRREWRSVWGELALTHKALSVASLRFPQTPKIILSVCLSVLQPL